MKNNSIIDLMVDKSEGDLLTSTEFNASIGYLRSLNHDSLSTLLHTLNGLVGKSGITFKGVACVTSASPIAPSEGDAYLASESGTIFGVVGVSKGEIVKYVSSSWVVDTFNLDATAVVSKLSALLLGERLPSSAINHSGQQLDVVLNSIAGTTEFSVGAAGLVPAPGSVNGYTLKDNGTWSGVNLVSTPSATNIVITNNSGTGFTLGAGSTITASLMLPSDKTKLDLIASGATVGADWDTNLSNIPSDWTGTLSGNTAANLLSRSNHTGYQSINTITAGNWKLFYSNGSGSIIELSMGTSGDVLTSNGLSSAPSFETPSSGFSNPLTTRGDIIYQSVSGTTRLPRGANGTVIFSDGTDIAWRLPVAADIADFDSSVSSNSDVDANTASRHAAVTIAGGSKTYVTLSGQQLTIGSINYSTDIVGAPNIALYVPYTGATTDVDLGVHSLTATDLYADNVEAVTSITAPTGIFSSKITLNSKDITDIVDTLSDPNSSETVASERAISAFVKSERENITSGITSTPSFTDNLDGTGTVGTGEYRLYNNSSFDGVVEPYTISGNTFTFSDLDVNYIYADYNGGTPILKLTSDVTLINASNTIPVFTVARQGNLLTWIDWDEPGKGLAEKLSHRLVKTDRFNKSSGLGLSETGTRNIVVTSGKVWYGSNEANLSSVDTTQVDSNIQFYYHSAGAWQYSTINQYNNTQYDDGSNLATLTDGNYAVNWVFRPVDESSNDVYVVLGASDTDLTNAQSAGMPTLPEVVSKLCIPVGRIIIQKNSTTATLISQVSSVNLTSGSLSDHSALTNVQGGTGGEQYHTTAAEYLQINKLVDPSNTDKILVGSGSSVDFVDKSSILLTDFDDTGFTATGSSTLDDVLTQGNVSALAATVGDLTTGALSSTTATFQLNTDTRLRFKSFTQGRSIISGETDSATAADLRITADTFEVWTGEGPVIECDNVGVMTVQSGLMLNLNRIGTQFGSNNIIFGTSVGEPSTTFTNNILIGDSQVLSVAPSTVKYNVVLGDSGTLVNATELSYNSIFGLNTLTNADSITYNCVHATTSLNGASATVASNAVFGNDIAENSTLVRYNLLAGSYLAEVTTSSVLYNQMTGLRIARNTTGVTSYNIISGYDVAVEALGSVTKNMIVGDDIAKSTTGGVSYNMVVGSKIGQDSISGEFKYNLIIGSSLLSNNITGEISYNIVTGLDSLKNTTNATTARRIVAFPYRALANSSAATIDDSIAIGSEAGYNNTFNQPALFGKSAVATADKQMVLGSSFYTGGISLATDTTVTGNLDVDSLSIGGVDITADNTISNVIYYNDVDTTPVVDATTMPISSSWAYAHVNDSNPHNTTSSDVGLGNVENVALSTWIGSSSITTLGTITSGTWNGDALTASYVPSHDNLTGVAANEHIDWTVSGAEVIHVNRISESSVTQHQAALSIVYSNIASSLTGRSTDNDGAWDFSANGILDAAFTSNTTISFTNLQRNKMLVVKVVISNSSTVTLPGYVVTTEGSAEAGGNDGTYWFYFHCLESTGGSEEVLLTITKAA
jgi:hypothetical protein